MSGSQHDLATHYRERVERELAAVLPAAATAPQRLHAAMRYASLEGGKRVRALLVYAAGTAVGAADTDLDAPACAVELVHAYSLVHDDLPAMDDDDLRRGKPTCHRAYDEATALLVGDALQCLAFEVLAAAPAGAVAGGAASRRRPVVGRGWRPRTRSAETPRPGRSAAAADPRARPRRRSRATARGRGLRCRR